jgi:hypothetical protein
MFLSLGLYENENYFCENESGFKNVSQKLDKNEPAIELVESNPDNSIKKIVALKSKSKTFSQSNNVLEDESKNVFNKLDSEDNRVTFGENVKKLKNRSNAKFDKKFLTFSNGFLASQTISMLIIHSITLIDEETFAAKVVSIIFSVLISIGLVFHTCSMKLIWKTKINKSLSWNNLAKIVFFFHLSHFISIFVLTGVYLYITFDQSIKNAYEATKKLVPLHVNLAVYLYLHFFNLLVYLCTLVSDIKFMKGIKRQNIM